MGSGSSGTMIAPLCTASWIIREAQYEWEFFEMRPRRWARQAGNLKNSDGTCG